MAINVSFVKLEMVREPAHRYNLKTRTIHGPEDADQAAREILKLDRQAQEVFAIFMLDTKNHITAVQEITRGSVNASIVHPREVFKAAVMANATSIICFHNHPSGNPNPSREDLSVTDRLIKAGHILDIPVLDHVIIGEPGSFVSLKERGMM